MQQSNTLELLKQDSASHFRRFSRAEWASLRADTPLTLTIDDLIRLRSMNDPVSMDDVIEIYLPLSRLLALYVAATQGLYKATQRFSGAIDGKVPYIIGITGSVAVGKSTTARILLALLSRWPNTPKVQLITTDGFLYPNSILEQRGLMSKKGFPESYDQVALINFLSKVKAGTARAMAPDYSHLTYDILPDEFSIIDRPDILIVEGVNVLQAGIGSNNHLETPMISDFCDFSIYLDAAEEALEKWYIERFFKLQSTAFQNPVSYFHHYAHLTSQQLTDLSTSIWRGINLVNLRENIRPTLARASLIICKALDHSISEVALRKL